MPPCNQHKQNEIPIQFDYKAAILQSDQLSSNIKDVPSKALLLSFE